MEPLVDFINCYNIQLLTEARKLIIITLGKSLPFGSTVQHAAFWAPIGVA